MRNYTFIEVTGKYRSLKEDADNNVFVSFGEVKEVKTEKKSKYIVHIYIGKNVAKKANFNEKDRLKFYISSEDILVFQILKSKLGIISFYKGKSPGILHTSTTWIKDVPPKEERKRRIVKFEIIKDGLIIDANPQHLEMHL